jgi:DNA-binding XRE family transcriptional regulator
MYAMTYSVVNYGVGGCEITFPPMAEPEETMGVRVSRQMEVKNLSQSALGRILGVSRMTVSQWCRDVSEPKPGHLVKLAELLFDGDVLYMIYGPAREPPGGFPTIPARDPSTSGRFPSPFVRRRKT